MKTFTNLLAKTKHLSVLVLVLFVFAGSAEKCVAQSASLQKNEPAVAVKQEPPIVLKMVDENGNEIKFITTTDEYKKMENKIREYEKQKGVTDRTGKVYFINSNYDVVSVTEQK